MLIHGTADTDVPYAQSEMMDKELSRQRVPHEFITIQNGPHGLRSVDPKVVNDTYNRVMAFLEEHMPATPAAKTKKG